jgi:hypothetical protein
VKSFNSVIMKFPKIDESLRNCRTIFQQFGELYTTLLRGLLRGPML